MKVAVLCEFSGIVRDAFIQAGHDAVSCDLEPSERPGPHIQGDCKNYDWSGYDLIIAHPPCTYLSVVANRAMKENPKRKIYRYLAFDFFIWCYNLPVKMICVENPKGYINSHFRKPDQIIQPYFFGDSEMKTTCLWLRGLPPLIHAEKDELFFKKTHVKKPEPKSILKSGKKRGQKVYFTESHPGNNNKEASKNRSRTFPGIAAAMAEQWGRCLLFSENELIDPEIMRTIKDMKKVGWKDFDLLESLLCARLKNSGRKKYIPTFKNQFSIIRRSL